MSKSLLVSFLLFLAIHGNAQTRKSCSFLGYFKKGVSLNYLSPLEADETKIKLGLHLGFAPSIALNSKFILKPELAYSLKGGRARYELDDLGIFDGEVNYNISYLEIPMVTGYKINKLFQLEGGSYLAIPLTTSFDFDGQFATGFGSFDRSAIHDIDYGIIGGVKIGPLGFRYYHGLSTLAQSSLAKTFLGSANQHSIQIYFQRNRFDQQFQRTEI